MKGSNGDLSTGVLCVFLSLTVPFILLTNNKYSMVSHANLGITCTRKFWHH